MPRRGTFRSKIGGMQKATGVRCPDTGIFFRSRAEFEVYCERRLEERMGQIKNLRCHTRHKLVVNGTLVTTYEDDFQYDRRYDASSAKRTPMAEWRHVIEDVKPPNFITDVAKLKIALFNAIHGPHGLIVTTTGRRTRR